MADDIRNDFPDDLPPSAASDPPLSLEARSPGRPDHVGRKTAFAMLALVLLIGVVAILLIASRMSQRPAKDGPDLMRASQPVGSVPAQSP